MKIGSGLPEKMKTNVLAVGVAVIDFVMNLDEFPRHADKYRANKSAIVGGGCGANAAVAIARLDGVCTLASRLGEDFIGDMIISGLIKEGVNCELTRQFSGCHSSYSSVFIDKTGERQIVNYRDIDLPSDASWLENGQFPYDAVLADTRWPEGAAAALALAKTNGVPGIIDAEAPFEGVENALRLASHVVFSANGLRVFSGANELRAGLEIAKARLPNFVGVTDGSNGVWWFGKKQIEHLPGYAIEAVDTLGAGDVWHGAFALALGENMTIEQALNFSNAAAALKCTRPGGGAGTPTRFEVETFIRNNKICS
jgi:sulfofructose kinase